MRRLALTLSLALFGCPPGSEAPEAPSDDEAIRAERWVQMRPRDAQAHRWRGITADRRGDYDLALSCYLRAAALEPYDASTHNNLAWLLATAADPRVRSGPLAVLAGERGTALVASPSHIDTLAAAYAEAGDFAQAAAFQREAIDALDEDESEETYADFEYRLQLYERGEPFHRVD